MLSRILKIALGVICIALIVFGILYAVNPAVKSWTNNLYTSITAGNAEDSANNDNPDKPNGEMQGPQLPADNDNSGDSDDENTADEEEVKQDSTKMSIEELWALITDNPFKAINIPYEGAEVFDVTADEYENLREGFIGSVMLNKNGEMTIYQLGACNKPSEGAMDSTTVILCDCSVGHKSSWDVNMGPFHWLVAEGNHALADSCWTYMMGSVKDVRFLSAEVDRIFEAACYWYETDAVNGEQRKVYGLRVCGSAEDPQPPKEPETFTLEIINRGVYGETLPKVITDAHNKTIFLEEGTSYNLQKPGTTRYRVGNGWWEFRYYSEATVVMNTNKTVTGWWYYNADKVEKPEEKPVEKPEEKPVMHNVTHRAIGMAVPAELLSYWPADRQVEHGKEYTPNPLPSSIKVAGGTVNVSAWNRTSATITEDTEFLVTLKFVADPVVVKEYTVTYKLESATAGKKLDAEVLKLKPEAVKVKEGTVVKHPVLPKEVVLKDGSKWVISTNWKTEDTVTNNITRTAKYKFVEAPKPEYEVSYKNASAQSWRTLPEYLVKNPPKATHKVVEGTVVKVPEMPFSYRHGNGYWTPKYWDKTQATVKGATEFTLYWEYKADSFIYVPSNPSYYTVSYEAQLSNGTVIKDANVLAALPKTESVVSGSRLDVDDIVGKTIRAADNKGNYRIDKCNYSTVTVNSNVKVVYTCTYTPINTDPVGEKFTISFDAKTSNGALISDTNVLAALPKAEKAVKGTSYTPNNLNGTTVKSSDGKGQYTCTASPARFIVGGSVTKTYTWKYTALETKPVDVYYNVSVVAQLASGSSVSDSNVLARINDNVSGKVLKGTEINIVNLNGKSIMAVDGKGTYTFNSCNYSGKVTVNSDIRIVYTVSYEPLETKPVEKPKQKATITFVAELTGAPVSSDSAVSAKMPATQTVYVGDAVNFERLIGVKVVASNRKGNYECVSCSEVPGFKATGDTSVVFTWRYEALDTDPVNPGGSGSTGNSGTTGGPQHSTDSSTSGSTGGTTSGPQHSTDSSTSGSTGGTTSGPQHSTDSSTSGSTGGTTGGPQHSTDSSTSTGSTGGRDLSKLDTTEVGSAGKETTTGGPQHSADASTSTGSTSGRDLSKLDTTEVGPTGKETTTGGPQHSTESSTSGSTGGRDLSKLDTDQVGSKTGSDSTTSASQQSSDNASSTQGSNSVNTNPDGHRLSENQDVSDLFGDRN